MKAFGLKNLKTICIFCNIIYLKVINHNKLYFEFFFFSLGFQILNANFLTLIQPKAFNTFFSLFFNKSDKLFDIKFGFMFFIHLFYLSIFGITIYNSQKLFISIPSNRCNKAYQVNIQFFKIFFGRCQILYKSQYFYFILIYILYNRTFLSIFIFFISILLA